MRNNKALIIGLIALVAILRVLYLALMPIDLSPDEAHYWEWSRRLDLSYYSKGPGVAYVIAFFTRLFGQTEVVVRLGAIAFSAGTSWMFYVLGRDLFGSERVGFWSALTAFALPMYSVGSILMTTDGLMIFFWALTVWAIHRALETGRLWWWLLAGCASGLGFLSKYTMAMMLPSAILFLLASRKDRPWLSRPGPYIGAIAGLVIASPVFLWNIANGQVTIKHTLGQAHIKDGVFSIAEFFEFLGAQAGLVTPILFAAIVYGVWKAAVAGFGSNRRGPLLAFFVATPIFAFFMLKSLYGKVQANWAVAAYVTALPAAIWAFMELYEQAKAKKALKWCAIAALCLGLVVTLLAYFPQTLSLFGQKRIMARAPYNRVVGWEELGQKVSDMKDRLGSDVFVVSDAYQVASELAFYMRENPATYNVNTGSRRMNQYDLWPQMDAPIGATILYVKLGDVEAEAFMVESFDACTKEKISVSSGNVKVRDFSVFTCSGFKGALKAPQLREQTY